MVLRNAMMLFLQGNLDEAMHEVNKQLESSLEDEDRLEYQLLKSNIMIKFGQYEDGLELAKQVLKKSQEIKNAFIALNARITSAEALYRLDKLDNCLKMLEIAENTLSSLQNLEQLRTAERNATIMSIKGNLYLKKGDYDLASECFHQSKKVLEDVDYEKVLIEDGDSGKNLCLPVANALFGIIRLSVESGEGIALTPHLQQLRDITEKTDCKIINHQHQIAEALVLRTSNRIINQAKAQAKFHQIMDERIIDQELKALAILNLCDLLLLEMWTSGDDEILGEIKTLSMDLENIAKNLQSYSLLAETYIIQSRLALLELNARKVKDLLTRAQNLAEKNGLKKLALKISYEHDSLLDQLSKWDSLEKDVSIAKRIELIQMENLYVRMIQKHVDDISETPEEPVLLLILGESGESILSKTFLSEKQFPEKLVTGFLTAINSFMREAFSLAGHAERIKHQEYTLLLRSSEPLMFCYAFKGQSYVALQKLTKFIEEVKSSGPTWTVLTAKSPVLTEELEKTLDGQIEGTFLSSAGTE
ncbi:MAG: tetratricopeptide repeat protein [Candidatus Odinarchaeota archaeon]